MSAPTRAAERLRACLDASPPDPPTTQADLARTLGVTPQAVSQWLDGTKRPTADRMAHLERLYGIPMREWLEPAATSGAP